MFFFFFEAEAWEREGDHLLMWGKKDYHTKPLQRMHNLDGLRSACVLRGLCRWRTLATLIRTKASQPALINFGHVVETFA